MGKYFLVAWRALPILVRATIMAFVVSFIGNAASALLLQANLEFHPELPWALPAMLILLSAFWAYFTGHGFPASTQAIRRDLSRRNPVPGAVWRAALLPIALSILTLTCLRLVLPSVLAMDAPKLMMDFTPYPTMTVVGVLLALAISAGVVEEIAFRGYMQKPLEEAYGIVPALLITGAAFWFAHANKSPITSLPFHMLASILIGTMAYLTRSLLPAIIGHAITDAVFLPAYYFQHPAFAWDALTARPVWETGAASSMGEKLNSTWRALEPANIFAGPHQTTAILAWVFVMGLIATVAALLRLARVARSIRFAE